LPLRLFISAESVCKGGSIRAFRFLKYGYKDSFKSYYYIVFVGKWKATIVKTIAQGDSF